MEIVIIVYLISALITALFFAVNSKELMLRFLNNRNLYMKGFVMAVFIPVINTAFAILTLGGLAAQGYYMLKNKFS